jgi:DNA-binding HxlR family transcriptional regulator
MYAASPAGRALAAVIFATEDWLARSPGPRLVLREDEEARVPIWAGMEGWVMGIVPALADGPKTLAELGRILDDVSCRLLASKLGQMSEAGLLGVLSDATGETIYAVTDWLREGIAPLSVAVRSGFRNSDAEEPPFAADDVETMFLLVLPLLRLPQELSGTCRLVAELPHDEVGEGGVMAHVEGGRVTSCSIDLDGAADGSATGPMAAWLDAMIDAETDLLEFGGEEQLPRTLVAGLHERLFRA